MRHTQRLLLLSEGVLTWPDCCSAIETNPSCCMMTSSNGEDCRVTGPLWGEPTGYRLIPSQRPSNAGFDVYFDVNLSKRLEKQTSRRWFEAPKCSLWRHCDGCDLFVAVCAKIIRIAVRCGYDIVFRYTMMTSSKGNICPRYWSFVRGNHRWSVDPSQRPMTQSSWPIDHKPRSLYFTLTVTKFCRYHPGYGLGQWETRLQSNAVSHQLSTCRE